MLLFAFTTILGNYYYCEGNLKYLLRREPARWEMSLFRLAAVVIVFFGALMDFTMVWDLADVLMGCMALINLPVILLLSKPVLLALKDYSAQCRSGRTPCSAPPGSECRGRRNFGTEQGGRLRLQKVFDEKREEPGTGSSRNFFPAAQGSRGHPKAGFL